MTAPTEGSSLVDRIYKKLLAKGLKPEQAKAMAQRAAKMLARKAPATPEE